MSVVTPDSPHGPESRPPARERVAEYYRTLWGYASHNDQTWQAADRALEAMRPEVEQLLFERDAAQATADNIAQQLEDLRDDVLGDNSLHVPEVASAAGREVERLTAEVAEAQRQARVWKNLHTAAAQSRDELAAELKRAVKDWGRNEEGNLADAQRLADENQRLTAEVQRLTAKRAILALDKLLGGEFPLETAERADRAAGGESGA